MTATPTVSVVMTTYNGERYVGETIEAVLAQSFTDFEFLIIDDCSTDGTVRVIERYHDPRIRLIRNNPNQGISNTRNIGIREARGRYLAAHDHDDISLPDRLAREVAALEADPGAVMAATATRTLLNGKLMPKREAPDSPPALAWSLMTHCPFVHSSICYRLETLRAHDIFYDQTYHYAEDWEIYIRLSDLGRILKVPDVLVHYRLHGDNNMLVHNEEMSGNGRTFLKRVYAETLGFDATEADIALFWKLAVEGRAATSRDYLMACGEFLDRLVKSYLSHKHLSAEDETLVRDMASGLWWRIVATAAKALGPRLIDAFCALPGLTSHKPDTSERLKTLLVSNVRPPMRALRGYLAS